MGRQLRDLTPATIGDLPRPCRGCVFWELSPTARLTEVEQDHDFEKEAWCSEVALLHGACGKVAYVRGSLVGFALYGPQEVFAGAAAFPARVSRDALFLATMQVASGRHRQGIAREFLRAALRDAKDRRKRALEAFGDRAWSYPACVLPVSFLEVNGFRVRREHPRFPLMRLDVRSLARVGESVEAAVEALIDSVRLPEPAARPAR